MVSFRVTNGDQVVVERMHAFVQGGGQYLLDNSPFHAFDISYGDVFTAEPVDGDLVFSAVVSRGGHSTYRVRLPIGLGHEHFLRHWPLLESLGCTYEGSSATQARLYSIDIPPGTDVDAVYRLLEDGERQNLWVFEEAHYVGPRDSHGV